MDIGQYIVWLALLVLQVCHAKMNRPSTIRQDLKALVKHTSLEVNLFVDTCTSSGEFEKVLLNMFPAVEVLVLRTDYDIRTRTTGKTITAILGEKIEDRDITTKNEETNEESSRVISFQTLDNVLVDNGYGSSCPEFIRVTDYGGNELSVLKGAQTTLACAKIVCVTGFIMRPSSNYPFAADVISFLNDKDFALYSTYENRRMRFFNVAIDMLFVKKDIMDEMFEVGFKPHMTRSQS